ncbi:hypothetical protein CASFOL_025378 [Castilleja foliolosa]|uniref:FAR1 domain-containing protein n=1 Tax=Castilleja foliolosa TaxID=1961234 RepID=A0ABD3CT87_9LAMI
MPKRKSSDEDFRLENITESSQCDGEASSIVSPSRGEITVNYTSQFTTYELFETRDDLLNWARGVGVENGIVVVVLRSDKGRVTLTCSKGGQFREAKPKPECKKKGADGQDDVPKKRDKGTNKKDCPFRLVGKQKSTGEWELEVKHGVHNHEVSVDLTGHAYVSRLKKEEMDLIDGMFDGSSRPKDILHKYVKLISYLRMPLW